MEAQDVLKENRSTFDNELNDLILGAVQPDRSDSPNPHAQKQPPSKRLKTGHGSEDVRYSSQDSDLEHKSSKVLQDRTNVSHPHVEPVIESAFKANDASIHVPGVKRTFHGASPSRNPTSRFPRPSGTLAKTVHRQWNAFRDDLVYEHLLDQRRREKLQKVDRYVPEYYSPGQTRSPSPSRPEAGAFRLLHLPEGIVKKILQFALVKSEPIAIEISSLRCFVKDRANIPVATQKLNHNGSAYLLPVSLTQLHREIDYMRQGMRQFMLNSGNRITRTRRSLGSPCSGLATSLLRVSREIGRTASDIFYGCNEFNFPCATGAWMQLDSFLATIGAENVARLQEVRVHVPLWHRGIHEDHIEGSVIDLLSPISRLTTPGPQSHDPLLCAIQRSTKTLTTSNHKLTLTLTLENGIAADYWTGRYVNEKRLFSLSDAEEHIERKRKGINCLKSMSDLLSNTTKQRPILTLSPVSQRVQADKKEFRQRFAGLMEEAAKYGWEVAPGLSVVK